jgi:hypothetical protein
MKILHEACVITCLDEDDPWRTERRSDGWNVGDVPPDESGSMQLADDPWTERRSSDWNIGEAPPHEMDSTHLALVPVECGQRTAEETDPIVVSVLTHQRIAELLRQDDASLRADGVGAWNADRRSPA